MPFVAISTGYGSFSGQKYNEYRDLSRNDPILIDLIRKNQTNWDFSLDVSLQLIEIPDGYDDAWFILLDKEDSETLVIDTGKAIMNMVNPTIEEILKIAKDGHEWGIKNYNYECRSG